MVKYSENQETEYEARLNVSSGIPQIRCDLLRMQYEMGLLKTGALARLTIYLIAQNPCDIERLSTLTDQGERSPEYRMSIAVPDFT
jgi:hypothetical protein